MLIEASKITGESLVRSRARYRISFICQIRNNSQTYFLASRDLSRSIEPRYLCRWPIGYAYYSVFPIHPQFSYLVSSLFQSKDAPRYLPGFLTDIVVYTVYVALMVLTRVILIVKDGSKMQEPATILHELVFEDFTDCEKSKFPIMCTSADLWKSCRSNKTAKPPSTSELWISPLNQ